jgi:Bacterial Ig-like domain (group 3)
MTATPRVLGAVILAMALGATATACSASASNTSGTSPAAGAHRPPPTGTVTVKAGNKVVCVMTIKAGKGTCKVSTKKYPPGSLRFDASYSGGPGYKPSHGSATVKLLGPTSSAGG